MLSFKPLLKVLLLTKENSEYPSKRKWIEMDRNGFVLFVSNPDSDLLNPFLSNFISIQ